MTLPVTLDTVSVVPSIYTRQKVGLVQKKISGVCLCGFQVPVFQRGGSVVCRSVGRGSCSSEFQQLPLSITVALSAQVRRGSSTRQAPVPARLTFVPDQCIPDKIETVFLTY